MFEERSVLRCEISELTSVFLRAVVIFAFPVAFLRGFSEHYQLVRSAALWPMFCLFGMSFVREIHPSPSCAAGRPTDRSPPLAGRPAGRLRERFLMPLFVVAGRSACGSVDSRGGGWRGEEAESARICIRGRKKPRLVMHRACLCVGQSHADAMQR